MEEKTSLAEPRRSIKEEKSVRLNDISEDEADKGDEYRKKISSDLKNRRMSRRPTVASLSSTDGSDGKANMYNISMSFRAFNINRRQSIGLLRRKSISASDRPTPKKLENTYQLKAFEGQEFNKNEVEKKIRSVLERNLDGVEYDPVESSLMTCSLANSIKLAVKDIDMPRYKLVCTVALGEKARQGIAVASRCLWNHETDSFATASYENSSIMASATVYGIYLD